MEAKELLLREVDQKCLKTWGQYNGVKITKRLSYYEAATEAGASYNFSIYGMTHADDKLRNGAKAWIKIKFFDGSWGELRRWYF